MKVAIVTDTFIPCTNGVVTSVTNQIKGLQKKGHKVIVLATGQKTKISKYNDAKVYYFKSRDSQYPDFKLWTMEGITKLRKILEKENPDIVHVHTPLFLGLALTFHARTLKIPVVSTYHTHVEDYAGHITFGKFRKFMNKTFGTAGMGILKFVYKYSDTVVIPGKSMERYLNKKGIKNTITIANGVESVLSKSQDIDIRKKYDIPKNAEIVFYFGRVSYEKKIDVLLKAFEIIKKKKKNAYLLIGGKGPELAKLKYVAEDMELEDVKFLGFVPDEEVASLFKECALFASASDSEIQPITFSEALFMGKPIVGTNKFGSNDMIVDGYNGFKFKPDKYRTMAKKILKILDNKQLAKEMGKNSRILSEGYTIEKQAENLIKLYDRCIQNL